MPVLMSDIYRCLRHYLFWIFIKHLKHLSVCSRNIFLKLSVHKRRSRDTGDVDLKNVIQEQKSAQETEKQESATRKSIEKIMKKTRQMLSKRKFLNEKFIIQCFNCVDLVERYENLIKLYKIERNLC